MFANFAAGQPLVPGRGTLVEYVGDDFEDPGWEFIHNMPKGSRENNERTNGPSGFSVNRRWIEGPERGQPDFVQVVPTPPDGLPGSTRALQISTLRSGVPGINTNDVQQDDLIASCSSRLGRSIYASELPSCVVRVYLPDPQLWENRSGPHFGFRLGCATTVQEQGFFVSNDKAEPYWPGIWIHFRSETNQKNKQDSAFLSIRSDRSGRDFKSIEITEFGWWTMGMSVTADGRVHYYAHPGIEDLTESDLLTSQLPYGFAVERMTSFFFDICNKNDGKTWSTPFVIDDPSLYVGRPERINQLVQRRQQMEESRQRQAELRANRTHR